MRTIHAAPIALAVIAAVAGCTTSGEDSGTLDWKRVPTTTLTLFYPAQSSFQWLRSANHPGASVVAQGTSCVTCHNGQEEKLGNKLVLANPLEPTPISGKNGVVRMNVQVAYDDVNAYFRFAWRTQANQPGDAYPYYRFDGKEWKPYGNQRLAAAVRKGEQPPIYEDRLTMMIDDGSVPGFANQGCWLTCHNGERDMPGQPTAAAVKANPMLAAIKRNDVRKYLPSTRTDALASWDTGRSLAEIEKVKASGGFLDIIQWRAHRSSPVGMADDGYVLEWRNFDAGKNMFASNRNAKTGQPNYMYDAGKVGSRARTDATLRSPGAALVPGANAVPFDPKAGWKAGDLLPQYFVSRSIAAGSAADNKNTRGLWKDGAWTVEWVRPRNLKNADDKALQDGKVYNFGFAVHDDNMTSRGHFVSFPVTVGFGAKATIEATRVK
jgi:hypothetical protein